MSSLKQKIWGGGSSRNAGDQSLSSKSPLLPSLSDSQISISSIKTKDGITPKSSQTSLNETGNDKNNDDDEFYDSNDGKLKPGLCKIYEMVSTYLKSFSTQRLVDLKLIARKSSGTILSLLAIIGKYR